MTTSVISGHKWQPTKRLATACGGIKCYVGNIRKGRNLNFELRKLNTIIICINLSFLDLIKL